MKTFFFACVIAAISTFSAPAGSASISAHHAELHPHVQQQQPHEPETPPPILGILAIFGAVAVARLRR
ncbi:hypothetical protein [Pseudoduganella aquatica]|uniref:PEP-CTERM sorting domain-containing protein n=1 Tax=Pseudoduganella aquatica TaxID=2660641 RepID=A0A7X4KPF8_9BURK|nr:hypothetical protein [Pseudoduganella aquatica]MYN09176.1 hypothetical protein [Pseudoduganella aquatica]